MARGFSLLLFPRFGMGEVRFEPEVKGEVGWGPDFGGMKSLGHMPLEGHRNVFLPPRAARRGARALEVGNAPFWRLPDGAGRRAGREARRNIRARRAPSEGSRVEVLVVFVLVGRCTWEVGVWRSGPWSDPFVGACSRWRVRALRRRRGLEAQLCQLCRANLRVRVRRAGESSPATRKARAQPQLH